ncbi:DUF2141 domain-containing protein [Pseudomonadota bacterium]
MKLIKFTQSALLITLMNTAPAWAELPGINVRVSGLSSGMGTVEVSLFNNAEAFMKEPYLQESGKANEDGVFETEFVSLTEGEYAIVVVHDANDNQKLDRGYFGFGAEDYGYSNNVRPWFGRPDFDQAKFTVDQPGTVVEISLD